MRLALLALLGVAALHGQLPAVPNSDFPTFRTNLNNSLGVGANIGSSYSNPSWITALAYAKLTGVPSFARTDTSNTWTTGTQNFAGAAHTLPAKVGTIASIPATCTRGEMYFATDASAGQNWYYCTSTNTWTAQSGGGSSVYSLPATFDGGGAVLLTGATTCTNIAYGGTLTGIALMAEPSGSATVDIQTETFANYITSGPGGASSIHGSGSIPSISSAHAVNPSITGFNTTIANNSVVCFVMSSPSSAQTITAILTIQ